MEHKPNAASASANPPAPLSDDPAVLQRELEDLGREMADVELKIRDLRASEDFEQGFYLHEEIFAAQQEKLRLKVEVDLRKRKLKRLEYGSQGA